MWPAWICDFLDAGTVGVIKKCQMMSSNNLSLDITDDNVCFLLQIAGMLLLPGTKSKTSNETNRFYFSSR